jgi:hypothetical protein
MVADATVLSRLRALSGVLRERPAARRRRAPRYESSWSIEPAAYIAPTTNNAGTKNRLARARSIWSVSLSSLRS